MADLAETQTMEGKETDYHQPRLNEVAQKFLADLDEERQRLGEEFPLCLMLIDEAFDRVYSTGRIPGKEYYADVYKQKPMKITQKVFIPVKQYPKFNFTGKILGPKGNSLRRLQDETQCKIAIKGRSSMRDREKEEELRQSSEPRYAHLHKDLFLEISTVATPAESYARVAYALAEIRKYLVPDKNDDVSHEQLRELMEIDPKAAKNVTSSMPHLNRTVLDKKLGGAPGAPKYQNLIKQTSYQQDEEHDLEDNYQYGRKRVSPPSYEYPKPPRAPPAPTFKRVPSSPHVYHSSTEVKRLREAPYAKPSYAVLKKYK